MDAPSSSLSPALRFFRISKAGDVNGTGSLKAGPGGFNLVVRPYVRPCIWRWGRLADAALPGLRCRDAPSMASLIYWIAFIWPAESSSLSRSRRLPF